jgi:signal transduction histidine kinase
LTHDWVRSSAGTEGEAGTGIGLKLSYELAISIGATLELRSELGKGTQAVFTIPQSPRNTT